VLFSIRPTGMEVANCAKMLLHDNIAEHCRLDR